MQIVKNIGFVLLALVWVSCEKEIPFDGEVRTPKITLNASFEPNNTWEVYLHNSLSVIDRGDLKEITNAQVFIFPEGQESFLLTYEPSCGCYQSPNAPVVQQTYRIEAAAPGFETVSAVSAIPQEVPILNVEVQERETGFSNILTFRVSFQDPSIQANFYMVELVSFFESTFFNFETQQFETFLFESNTNILSNDPSSDQRSESDFLSPYLTFNDNLFNNQSKTFVFEAESFDGSSTTEYQLILSHLSEELYLYKRSILRFSNSAGNPFAEPARVFTNVNNGFGIFGGFNSAAFEVR
ncbi:MAG: DUF4249 domain-containing protein [Luteibaculaceae bacterium]